MPIKFHEVDVGDRFVLPGRKGRPDEWVVTRKYPKRIFLQSILDPSRIAQMMDNQFDAKGYEPTTIFPEDEPYVEEVEEGTRSAWDVQIDIPTTGFTIGDS